MLVMYTILENDELSRLYKSELIATEIGAMVEKQFCNVE